MKPEISTVALACLLLTITPPAASGQTLTETPVPSLFPHAALYEDALRFAVPVRGAFRDVTGVIVPHHLLAIDVMAGVFASIQANNAYETIFVLLPDHFSASETPAATTLRRFETPFGDVAIDQAKVETLLDGSLVSDAPRLFETEHAVHAVLPFVAKVFPDARVVPLALRVDMSAEDVSTLVERLMPLISRDALVLLSVDFSHYLPFEEALKRDQETLNILAAGDYEALGDLRQPDHVDSRAGLHVQMAVQTGLGSEPLVIESKNSQQYTDVHLDATTSYVGAIFSTDLNSGYGDERPRADLCFAGDVFTGRTLHPFIGNVHFRKWIAGLIRDTLGPCPLVVNLESVLTEEPVTGAPPLALWADAEATLDLLRRMGTGAVSLANNHSRDLGERAYHEMVSLLVDEGFDVIKHGSITDLGRVRVFGLTEGSKRNGRQTPAIGESDFDVLRNAGHRPPILAFVHWGRQFENKPREPQRALTGKLRSLGISGIIGSHPHRASDEMFVINGGSALVAYSLGNFLFDQRDELSSGRVLEVYAFEQGTFFARLVQIPNFYELIWDRRRELTGLPGMGTDVWVE